MQLIAAIDLLDGRAVRLRQGRYDDVVEAGDPAELARPFATAGVPRLHVVDLDGARAGEPRNAEAFVMVVGVVREAAPGIRIQAAGGLRTKAAVATALETGVDDVVLGTAAIERPGFLAACAARWPGRVHASIDIRDRRVALDGWERDAALDAMDVAARLLEEGAAGLVITDTRRDGTLTGPNTELLAGFRARFPNARLVAAGGVRSLDDLRSLDAAGIDGAIAGMALLAGTISIEDAIAVTSAPPGAAAGASAR